MEKDPKKIEFNKGLKTVLYVLRDDGGCGFYRGYQPASFLRRAGLMNTIVDLKTTTPEHILQADVVVFQESGTPAAMESFNFAKAKGKPVIVELDDYLNGVSPHNPGYASWNPSTLYLFRATEMMVKADAMTVSTPQLAREYFPFNPNIYIVPNFLDKDKWDNLQTKKKDGYLRIGWAGGNAHIDDLKLISKAIEKVIHNYKDKVKFETMGMIKRELQGAFKLEEFDHICPKCNYQGDSVVYSGETLDNYPIVLASHGWDIAVAPIVNTAFNSAKSDLKLKEYSATGYPVIASAVTPYIEAKKDGCNVLLAENFEEWYNNIIDLIENPEKRDKIVDDNKQWVSKYWIQDNIGLFHEIYTQVINNHK